MFAASNSNSFAFCSSVPDNVLILPKKKIKHLKPLRKVPFLDKTNIEHKNMEQLWTAPKRRETTTIIPYKEEMGFNRNQSTPGLNLYAGRLVKAGRIMLGTEFNGILSHPDGEKKI